MFIAGTSLQSSSNSSPILLPKFSVQMKRSNSDYDVQRIQKAIEGSRYYAVKDLLVRLTNFSDSDKLKELLKLNQKYEVRNK